MTAFKKWISQAFASIVDPDREQRVAVLVRHLHAHLQQQRQAFSLSKVLSGVEYRETDLALASERLYETILAKGWEDEYLTPKEQDTARWVAVALQIAPHRAAELNSQFARNCFANALAQALEDGQLDAQEEERLARIAASVGASTAQFTRAFFRHEGESFLRGIFSACVADNQISEQEWNYLLAISAKLGIAQAEFLAAIQPQARQFVEHVLADAKADGRLSQNEDASLRWLLQHPSLPAEFAQYVQAEARQLRMLTDISDGKLPSLSPPPGLGIKAGEIIHFHGTATFFETRILKSDSQVNQHQGSLILTDHRIVFSSQTKSHSVNYRKVLTYQYGANFIDVQTENKPIYRYVFPQSPPYVQAIFCSAVAMANQTLTAKTEDLPSRHIPRDVRQRVWQRFGGRCAECNADDYLEFDHIIPVARGGSSSDANVQLLCRRCNLKKSNHI